MDECTACRGTGNIDLPTEFGVYEDNCPCCRPWSIGFGGYGYMINGKMFWVIEPSEPNQPAKHNREREHTNA